MTRLVMALLPRSKEDKRLPSFRSTTEISREFYGCEKATQTIASTTWGRTWKWINFSRGELGGENPVVTLLWQSRYSPRVWWVPGITDAKTRGRAAVTLIDQCVLRQHAHTHSVRHANTKSRQQQKVKAQCCCRPTVFSFLFPPSLLGASYFILT